MLHFPWSTLSEHAVFHIRDDEGMGRWDNDGTMGGGKVGGGEDWRIDMCTGGSSLYKSEFKSW